MPSKFIIEQAKLLYELNDPFTVQQNLRDKYTKTSYPSQMTRVKDIWYKYEDRHPQYNQAIEKAHKYLREQGISRKYISQFETFVKDDMKTQLKKVRFAKLENLTGSSRTDSIISNIPILPVYMHDYRLTQEDKIATAKISSESLEKRSMECVDIKDTNELVKKCQHIVKHMDEDLFIIIAALGIICGRRSIEILKLGQFEENKKRGRFSCKFKGMAKKRGCGSEDFINIPLLTKFEYFKRCLNYIRSQINTENMTNSIVNSKYSHKLGDGAKILLESLNVRFHDLRVIYGNATYQAFRNTWSINIWLKKVLGHESIDTSVYYSRCKMTDLNLVLGEWN